MSENGFESADAEPGKDGQVPIPKSKFIPISPLAPQSKLIPMSKPSTRNDYVDPIEPDQPDEPQPAPTEEPPQIADPPPPPEPVLIADSIPIADPVPQDDPIPTAEMVPQNEPEPIDALGLLNDQIREDTQEEHPPWPKTTKRRKSRRRKDAASPKTSSAFKIISIILACIAGVLSIAVKHNARSQRTAQPPVKHTLPDWDDYERDIHPNRPSSGSSRRTYNPGTSGSNRYNPHTDPKRINETNARNSKRMQETMNRHLNSDSHNHNRR